MRRVPDHEIVVKKGQTVLLKGKAGCAIGADYEEEYVAAMDLTQKDMDDLAWETALEQIQPEGWWEIKKDEGEE
jgi:hypothetical protein